MSSAFPWSSDQKVDETVFTVLFSIQFHGFRGHGHFLRTARAPVWTISKVATLGKHESILGENIFLNHVKDYIRLVN